MEIEMSDTRQISLSGQEDEELVECNWNFSHKYENSEQSSRPYTFDPRNIESRLSRGYKMLFKKGTKQMTLLRFLLAKLVYGVDGLSLEEYLCLYHLFYDLTEEKSKDLFFLSKYAAWLERVELLMRKMAGNKIFPVIPQDETKKIIERLLVEYLPSPRAYFGLSGQRELRQSFRLVLNDTLMPRKALPQRFIGVGYKDKGTCRDLAFDGNPSWQTVATYLSNLEREAEEVPQSNDSQEFEDEVT